MLGTVLMDAYVDTGRTVSMAIADRRLDAGEHAYPIELSSLDDVTVVRKAFLRSMPKIGQQPGAQGGGNARKRVRLVISLAGVRSAARLADAIAAGIQPPNEDGRAAEKTA